MDEGLKQPMSREEITNAFKDIRSALEQAGCVVEGMDKGVVGACSVQVRFEYVRTYQGEDVHIETEGPLVRLDPGHGVVVVSDPENPNETTTLVFDDSVKAVYTLEVVN